MKPAIKLPKRKAERHMLRVIKGGFAPADVSTASRLRERGIRVGDLIAVEIKKPRNPGFHRLAHALGQLLVDNVPDFELSSAHGALKRIQVEADIGCETMVVKFPGLGAATCRIPQSLAYESMDQTVFEEVFRAMCKHVAANYWPDLTPEQVAQMAELMGDQA